MRQRLEDHYFEWLYTHFGVVSNRNPKHSYWELFRYLHQQEFVWLVPNDDNRVEDGKALRLQFIQAEETDEVDVYWLELGCSVLEMLVALAGRASYETSKEPGEWIWIFLQNLGLDKFSDLNWDQRAIRWTEKKLEQLIYRRYSPSGRGGLFPLRNAAEDQRNVELWYQLSAYLIETENY